MATKKTKVVAEQPAMTDKEVIEAIAKIAILPSANAAMVITEYSKSYFGAQDLGILAVQLQTKFDQVGKGDLQHCEAMLVGQAHALQSIFVNLARRAINQDNMKYYETFLRLALKAQNQCRMTLETLATIKNPPVVFAKQANINQGSGNQQVNNGIPASDTMTSTRTHAHAGENKIQQNELLEVQHGSETVDNQTTGATIGKNPAMATVD